MTSIDICVHCGCQCQIGTGRFVNRVPADADFELLDSNGNVIYEDGEYRDGYSCADCQAEAEADFDRISRELFEEMTQ